MDAWRCDGYAMRSTADIERYLRRRAVAGASVKLIHTYDEWMTPNGMLVRIGTGLSKGDLIKACAFLVGGDKTAQSTEERFGNRAGGCWAYYTLLLTQLALFLS